MNIQLFKDLCEATGAPGFEYGIRELVIKEMTPLADEIKVDNVGNVVALIKGKLQYSCLENYMDRGAWQGFILWGHKEPDTTE